MNSGGETNRETDDSPVLPRALKSLRELADFLSSSFGESVDKSKGRGVIGEAIGRYGK